MKILYLEDDINLSQTVEEYLIDEGFDVTCAYDGEEALENIYENIFDLLILDVNVPKINGFNLLSALRDANIHIPAIFTTSLSSFDDLSKGYSVGADDYVKKPFALKELLFRIQALLKREFNSKESLVKLAKDVDFNTSTNELISNTKVISINPKEALLLKLLIKNKNRCVSFEEIYQNVWSYDETPSEMSLRTYIKNLRKHIPKENILSIKKVGYKFV